MRTKPNTGLSLFNTRGVGEQLIPYEEYFGASRLYGNKQTYNTVDANKNQIALYNNFKMEVLAAETPETLQDIIADTPIVSACMAHYTDTCSTVPQLEGGTRAGRALAARLIESEKFKIATDQAFDMLFKRGGFVVEAKYTEANGVYLPEEFKIHDLTRFSFELVPDPRYKNGQKYALQLKNYLWNRQDDSDLLDSPTIKLVVKKPKPNEKPVGRSRITASTYMAAVHVKVVDSIKEIFSKSGSPTLTASYNQEKLFGGPDKEVEFFSGDPTDWMRREIKQFTEKAKQLPQGDVLVVPGPIEIGDYLMPGQRVNTQGLSDYSNELKVDICLAVEVPPNAIGIIQRSSSLNDDNTKNLIKKFNNNCHSDQNLVASAFQALIHWTTQKNQIRPLMSNPLRFFFEFSNPESTLEQYMLQKERAETEASIIANIEAAKAAGYINETEAKARYVEEMAMLDLATV